MFWQKCENREMADKTSNFEKHASKNPLQKLLIGNFYKALLILAKDLKVKTILDAGCGEGFTLQKFYEAKIGEHLEELAESVGFKSKGIIKDSIPAYKKSMLTSFSCGIKTERILHITK